MPNKKTTEQFIIDAIKIHGNKFDYCKDNNIGLLRINYKDISKIEEILNRFI